MVAYDVLEVTKGSDLVYLEVHLVLEVQELMDHKLLQWERLEAMLELHQVVFAYQWLYQLVCLKLKLLAKCLLILLEHLEEAGEAFLGQVTWLKPLWSY